MNTTKATYWIALATFALALNSGYQHRKFPALHRVAGRAGATLCRITTRAEQTLAMARFLTDRSATPQSDDLATAVTEMAEAQADLSRERGEVQIQVKDNGELARKRICAQTAMIRAQVQMQRSKIQMQRAQIDQIRSRARSQVHFINSAVRRVVVIGPEECAKESVGVDAGPDSSDDDKGTF